MAKVKISVITATLNSAKYLPRLIESLRCQTNKEFEWVVVDGGSTDETLNILQSVKNLNILIDSQPDFGIYDALNRGIKICSGDYYLVVGSDDVLYNEAINMFTNINSLDYDFIAANVDIDGVLRRPFKKSFWRYGVATFFSAHAVGTLIKKDLHNIFGYYSPRLYLAADQLFLLKAVNNAASICYIDHCVGEYSTSGASSSDLLGTLTESYRALVYSGCNFYVQTFLYVYRLLILFAKIKKSIRNT